VTRAHPIAPPSESKPFIDFLRVPVLGTFLRWPHSRMTMQIPLLGISIIMVLHAFLGPQLAPKNIATLLTWVHFRGMVVVALLLAGNLFCMACPFMLPRDIIRKRFTPRWHWPRWLHNKWPAIVLFVLALYLYELLDLWGDPWWTGVAIVAYFAGATVIDTLFRGASFCKHVCPIGQFNFLGSALSPLEVAVRDKNVCTSCGTYDCIRGTRVGATDPDRALPYNRLPIIQRGCELSLFQPRKVGNLDCTVCLDCVYACPHDNVGIMSRLPAEELTISGTRSGVGAVERRFDLTALFTVFTFGAILNAFAMISPVYALEQAIARRTGLHVEWPILAGLFAVAIAIEPAILLGGAAAVARRVAGSSERLLSVVNRFARSLVPLGFGIWLAHYGFHFFTGFLTIIPVTQNAVAKAFGTPFLGEPMWRLGGLPVNVVLPLEMGFLALGLIGSWMVTWSIAREFAPRRTGATFAPWAIVHAALFAAAVWIMHQPMDMRGTFLG
jgi:polyferredoxin